jgi:hypothetical protein
MLVCPLDELADVVLLILVRRRSPEVCIELSRK